MKRTIFLLILLVIFLNSFAPTIPRNNKVTWATIEEMTKQKLEVKEAKKVEVRTKELTWIANDSKADSAALLVLNQYRRDRTEEEHHAFISKIKEVSDKLNIKFNWLVGIMHHESRFNPQAVNEIGATGLIQFLWRTAKGLGTTTTELYNMTAVEQMDYVYEFYKPAKGKIRSATDLYLYAFFPVAVLQNWPNSKIIEYKRLTATKVRNKNPGLDTNKDGVIKVGEFRRYTFRHCNYKMYKTKKYTIKYRQGTNVALKKLVSDIKDLKITIDSSIIQLDSIPMIERDTMPIPIVVKSIRIQKIEINQLVKATEIRRLYENTN